jgi:hypothetical protein
MHECDWSHESHVSKNVGDNFCRSVVQWDSWLYEVLHNTGLWKVPVSFISCSQSVLTWIVYRVWEEWYAWTTGGYKTSAESVKDTSPLDKIVTWPSDGVRNSTCEQWGCTENLQIFLCYYDWSHYYPIRWFLLTSDISIKNPLCNIPVCVLKVSTLPHCSRVSLFPYILYNLHFLLVERNHS